MTRFRLLLIPAAYSDLKEARDWYRAKNHQLPKRFSQQVKITMEHIRACPTAHAIRYKDVRIAKIAVFPYAVHFLIEANNIIVLAVHHTALDPNKWIERI